MKSFNPKSLSGCIAGLVLLASGIATQAATITKANNTTAITTGSSWVGGVAPGSADIGLFDSTITGALSIANTAAGTGGALQFTTIGGNIAIGMGSGITYTLGNNVTYEIDMSSSAADVTIGGAGSTAFLRWASAAAGGINVASGRTLTLNCSMNNQANTKTITMTGGGNIVFNNGAGSGGAMGFSIQGGTTVTMNGTGGWAGGSLKEVKSGTLNIGNDLALNGQTLTLGGTSSSTPTLAATGGARTISSAVTLTAVTTGSATIAGANNLTVNGTLLNSGGDRTLTVNNSALTTFGAVNLSEGATARTLTINGSGSTVISGIIANGGTATSGNLTYAGTGTLTLSGANTYAGTTTVSSGKLINTTASTSLSAFTVAAGATLGAKVAAAGQSFLMSSLAFSGANSTNEFDLAGLGHTTAPVLTNAGALTMNGNVVVNVTNGPVTVGTSVLFTYASGARTGTGSFVSGMLPPIPGSLSASIVDDTINRQVKLVIVSLVANLKWAGGDGNWDTGTANWVPVGGGSPALYTEGDLVNFDDSASGSSPITVTLTASRSPGGLTVSNSTKDYVLNGSAVAGIVGMAKYGAAKLTLASDNTLSGGITINAGTVQVGTGSTSGSIGSGSVANAGTLAFKRSDSVAVANVINGSGGLRQEGAGTLTLSGGNGYTGGTVIANGVVSVAADNNLGSAASTLTIDGGQLADSASFTMTRGVSIGAGHGAINVAGGQSLTLSGNITGAGDLSVAGSGTLILGGANSYGATTISGSGTLQVGAGGTAGTLGSGNVTNNASLAFSRSDSALNVANVISGSGSVTKFGGGTVTLSGNNTYVGGTTISAGAIKLANNAGAGTGNITATGQLQLGNGIILNNSFTANQTFECLDVPDAGAIAYVTGLVGNAGNGFRFSATGSGSTLIYSNATVTITSSGKTFWPTRGNIVYAGNTSINNNNNTQPTLIGRSAGNAASLTIKDNAVLNCNAGFNVGDGGGVNSSLSFTLQDSALVNLNTAAFNTLNAGVSGVTLNLNGGTLAVGSIIKFSANAETMNWNGTTIKANASSTTFFPALAGLTVNIGNTGAIVDTAGFNIGVDAPLLAGGTGGLTKNGTGTLSLNGANTYSGVTTVNAGTLGGTGSLAGDLTVASVATLAAGNSIGTFTVNGAASLSGTVVAEVTNGPAADKIVFNGGATLGGTLTVTSLGTLTAGNSFDLFDGTTTGAFATLNLPNGTNHWNLSALYTTGTITYNGNAAPVASSFDLGVAVGGSATAQVIGKFVTDADGDTVTITAVSTPTSGTATIVGGTNITYVNTATAASDSFTYTVTDSLGATDTKTVTVTISVPTGFNLISGPTSVGGGQYQFDYLGIPGQAYAIEEAASLTPPITWTPVATNTAAGNGALSFTITPSNPSGYFRTRSIP